MVTDGVRNLGRLFDASKSEYYTQNLGPDAYANAYSLLGDPAMDIKLSPLPTPVEFYSGAEIENASVLQDRVIPPVMSGITNPSVRVWHGVDADVSPLNSDRMIRVKASDSSATADSVEWILQNLNLTVNANSVLSFWLNIKSSPSNNGKIVIGRTWKNRTLDGSRNTGRREVRAWSLPTIALSSLSNPNFFRTTAAVEQNGAHSFPKWIVLIQLVLTFTVL